MLTLLIVCGVFGSIGVGSLFSEKLGLPKKAKNWSVAFCFIFCGIFGFASAAVFLTDVTAKWRGVPVVETKESEEEKKKKVATKIPENEVSIDELAEVARKANLMVEVNSLVNITFPLDDFKLPEKIEKAANEAAKAQYTVKYEFVDPVTKVKTEKEKVLPLKFRSVTYSSNIGRNEIHAITVVGTVEKDVPMKVKEKYNHTDPVTKEVTVKEKDTPKTVLVTKTFRFHIHLDGLTRSETMEWTKVTARNIGSWSSPQSVPLAKPGKLAEIVEMP